MIYRKLFLRNFLREFSFLFFKKLEKKKLELLCSGRNKVKQRRNIMNLLLESKSQENL